MTPKQNLNKLLAESGAVVPPDKVHKLPEMLGVKPPKPIEVIKTFKFNSDWDIRAVNKMASFFEQMGQLRRRYKADNCHFLEISFMDNAQAERFSRLCAEKVFTHN